MYIVKISIQKIVTYRAVTKFMSCFHAQAASLTNVSSESGVLAKKLSKKRNEELNVTMINSIK